MIRNARKADNEGFVCKPFTHRMFIPDIVSINQSKEIRSDGPMSAFYRRSVERMGGAPVKMIPFKLPDCPVHYSMLWGIFSPESGYKQGDVVTNERLLAYTDLRYTENFSMYSLILGHGDYLK
jgi:hypothetical protein